MKGSLRAAFVGICALVVATCVALALLMQGLHQLGIDAQLNAVAARVDRAAASLQTRFGVYARSDATPLDFTDAGRRRELGLIARIVLQDYEDVEGGFYSPKAGFVAYAFPSSEGSGPKQDVPDAESAHIATVAARAVASGVAQSERDAGARQTLILAALPAAGSGDRLAVWAMSRAHVRADDGSNRLLVGLALLGFFVAASGIALLMILRRWNRALAQLSQRIADAPADQSSRLEPTGHADLDRIAATMSSLHRRHHQQRRAAARLQDELARAQRVATVGRMAAQLIHEIRNPIAAMRLRAENALAGAADRGEALDHILKDVHRLDELLERMQAMTPPNALRVRAVALCPWLDETIASLEGQAAERSVTLLHDAADADWPIDPDQLARAVGNVVSNAIRHVAAGSGHVAVRITVEPQVSCRITIDDNGPGIPDDAFEQIFEPFHTTRPDGTGLGLSIAREIVEAHGGTLRATRRHDAPLAGPSGATLTIELPWRAS